MSYQKKKNLEEKKKTEKENKAPKLKNPLISYNGSWAWNSRSSVNGWLFNNLEIKVVLLHISLVVITTKFSVLVTCKTSSRQKLKLQRSSSSVLVRLNMVSSQSTNYYAFSCLVEHPLRARLRAREVHVYLTEGDVLFSYHWTIHKNSHSLISGQIR